MIEVPDVELPVPVRDMPFYFGTGLPYESGGWAVPLSSLCM